MPDIVEGGSASLKLSKIWLPKLAGRTKRMLIPVQDGMEFSDFEDLVGPNVGVFLGGSTEWKINAIIPWSQWARSRGAWCHVGRVNTARRIALCVHGGATSFDGSSVSKFSKTLPLLDNARRQTSFESLL